MAKGFQFEDFKDQLEYLHERGLDDITIKRLGLEIKTATWLGDNGIKWQGLSRGIVWQLRNLRGELTGKIGARVFYQKSIVDVDKPKFLPQKGEVPGVYFSPLANWDKLEYGQRIFICESYLKADIAALCGFHALGISGCWGWSHNNELNWDFKQLPWKDSGLVPIVCMDSDVNPDNPKLYQAARKFNAEILVRCGVHAQIIVLPAEDKTGLDDYYVEQGKNATVELLQSDAEPLPDAMTDHLKIMATEVAFIEQIARMVRINDGLIMTRGDFENMHYADRQIWNEDGKPVPVAKTYIKWPDRTVVNELVYKPGEARLGDSFYNAWEGMGVEPLAADVKLFTSWINDVFDSDTEREWFLDWWSWQLQNLGGKLTTGLVMVGPPGIGKGWISHIFARIFGIKNVAKAPLTVLERPFNADIAAKQLFIVEETDEIGGSNQRVYNNLKDLITNTTIRLEKKGVDAILIDNCLNVFLTGNQVGIFKLDAGDRRFAVLECVECEPGYVANNSAYWDRRWDWVDNGGAEAIYGHLLARDLARFNPKGMAPMTSAKQDMVELTHSSIELWLTDLRDAPDDVLISGQSEVDGSVASAKELMWLYLGGRVPMHDIERSAVTKMNSALKNARFEPANEGKKIKDLDGYPTRYFIIRPVRVPVPIWGDIVRNRMFWQRLVASSRDSGSQPDPSGNGDSKY